MIGGGYWAIAGIGVAVYLLARVYIWHPEAPAPERPELPQDRPVRRVAVPFDQDEGASDAP